MTGLYQRFAMPLFWTMVALVYAAAIMPSPQAPDLGAGDKVNHVAAFLTLTLIGRTAYRSLSTWRLGLGLSLFGALIELTQAIPIFQRDASVWDWIADSVAIIVMLGVCRAYEWRTQAAGAA